MSDYHQIAALERRVRTLEDERLVQRIERLEREAGYQKESILMMSRALEQLAACYESMLPAWPIPTPYANAPNEDPEPQ